MDGAGVVPDPNAEQFERNVKLLKCPWCGDIFRLYQDARSCKCGEVRGYIEKRPKGKTVAYYTGPGRVIGMTAEDLDYSVGAWYSTNREVWEFPIYPWKVFGEEAPGEAVKVPEDRYTEPVTVKPAKKQRVPA